MSDVAANPDAPSRYVERGDDGRETVVYRASAIGQCERALIAAGRGVPRAPMPDWFRKILDEGKGAETIIDSMWVAKSGEGSVDHQRCVELEIGEIDDRRVIVRGHIDAASEGGALREYKKFRISQWGEFQRRGVEILAAYPWQVSVYMHGGGYQTCEFVGGKYIFKEDDVDQEWGWVDDVDVAVLDAPPISFKAIRQRVARLERLLGEGFDPPEVECSKSMFPCPYWKLHDQDEQRILALDESNETLRMILGKFYASQSRITNLNAQIRELEGHKREAAEGLKAIIEANGADDVAKFTFGEYTLTRYREDVPERVSKPYSKDYFRLKVKQGKETEAVTDEMRVASMENHPSNEREPAPVVPINRGKVFRIGDH